MIAGVHGVEIDVEAWVGLMTEREVADSVAELAVEATVDDADASVAAAVDVAVVVVPVVAGTVDFLVVAFLEGQAFVAVAVVAAVATVGAEAILGD